MSRSLNLDALGAQIRNHHVHAALLDGAQPAGRHAQAQEAFFRLGPEAVSMQIRQKAAPLAIVRVGNRITRFGALARDLADSRHGVNLWTWNARNSRALYQGARGPATYKQLIMKTQQVTRRDIQKELGAHLMVPRPAHVPPATRSPHPR